MVLILYLIVEQRQAILRETEESAQRLVRLAAAQHEAIVEGAEQLLTGLGRLSAVHRGDATACHAFLAELLPQYPRYANLGVLHRDGRLLCSALPFAGQVDASRSNYFRRALETRQFAIGDYQVDHITRRPALYFGYPVSDSRGTVQAVVFGALKLSWLDDIVQETLLPPGSLLVVFDQRGTILARKPKDPALIGHTIPESVVATLSNEQGRGAARATGVDGVERLYVFGALRTPAKAGRLYVSVGLPEDAFLVEVSRGQRRTLIALLVTSLLVVSAAWFGGEWLLARRLRQLAHTAERFGKGDLQARTGLAYGQDELGVLTRTLDDMAAALETRTRELEQNRFFLEKAQEVAHIGSWISEPNANGRLTWSSETHRIFGFAEHEFDRRVATFFRCVHPDDLERVQEASRAALAGEKPYRVDHRIVRPDGSVCWVHQRAEVLRDAAGAPVSMVGVVQDISRRMEREARIQHLAYYDPLTGLPNRALLHDRLQQAVAEADRHQRQVGVMLLDLDRFKDINDSLGHDAGDQLLKSVSERLAGAVRKGDTVARLGGDEFVVILPDLVHTDDAARVAHKVMEAFARPFHLLSRELYVGTSVGITIYPHDDRSVPNLMRNADIAMYRAKEAGRNAYQFYTAEMTVRVEERLAIENDLQRALRENEFFLVYQPIVDIRSERIVGVEALLRWRHPTRGTLLPERFIALAEETGLVVPIGEWVLQTACRQGADWRQRGLPNLRIGVNLAARHFRQPSLLHAVRQAQAQTGFELRHLELELTESTLFGQDPPTISPLEVLSEMGVSLAIDDFGTGYSNLGYLQRFPIRTLKIDRSFIRGVPHDPDSTAIATTIITLAHSLGMRVVAEGVETAEQLQFLRRHHCDAYQGFYLADPLPPTELEQMLVMPRTRPQRVAVD
jgi:diguanylate cyclase (GGDEF)-like protein/PAS domain S-box-containing protein